MSQKNGQCRGYKFVVDEQVQIMSPISGHVRISNLYLISKVQIMSLRSGQVREFRFVVDELGSDFIPNMWPC